MIWGEGNLLRAQNHLCLHSCPFPDCFPSLFPASELPFWKLAAPSLASEDLIPTRTGGLSPSFLCISVVLFLHYITSRMAGACFLPTSHSKLGDPQEEKLCIYLNCHCHLVIPLAWNRALANIFHCILQYCRVIRVPCWCLCSDTSKRWLGLCVFSFSSPSS